MEFNHLLNNIRKHPQLNSVKLAKYVEFWFDK